MKKISAVLPLLLTAAVLLSLCGCSCTNFTAYEDPGSYSVGGGYANADEITEILVNWVSGSVRIEAADTDRIVFSEISSMDKKTDSLGEATKNKELSESLRMRYKTENGMLTIQFCKSGLRVRSGAVSDLTKDLTIYVPRTAAFKNVRVDAVSSSLYMLGIDTETVDLNTVSGDLKLSDCVTDSVVCSTVTGKLDITTDQMLKNTDFNSVSGDLMISAKSIGTLNAESVSANAVLYLKEFDFTLSISGVSATFEAGGLSYQKTGENKYKFNDGTGSVSFESVSGKVRLEEK